MTGLTDTDISGLSFRPEQVSFAGGDGTIGGYLFLPPGQGPFPCAIDNHGSVTPLSNPQTAHCFLSWGCAYLIPHRAGYGISDGVPLADAVPAPRGTPEHDDQMSVRLEIENRDVIAALDFAISREEIDPDHIFCMGSSLGGIHTLLALSHDTRWACGVDFSGGASQWAKHPKIKARLLQAARTLTQPICLIQPENDFNTAPTAEISAKLAELGKPHDARIFPPWGTDGGEAHRFCAAGQNVWGPFVRAFLEKYV